MSFGTPSAELEPNAQATPICAPLLERGDQFLFFTLSRKPPALVVDIDENAIGAASNAQRHGTVRPRELERVLQEIPDHRCEDLLISFNRQFFRHGGNNQLSRGRPPPVSGRSIRQ